MAPGLSAGWTREMVPLTAVAGVTMNDWPPSEYEAPRMKSAWPPVDEM